MFCVKNSDVYQSINQYYSGSCGEGYEEGNMTGTCRPCAPGYYKAFVGRHNCDPCPLGTYRSLPAQTDMFSCTPCPVGFTTNTTAADNAEECLREYSKHSSCLGISYWRKYLIYVLMLSFLAGCPPGFYYNGTCTACPEGTYQPMPFQSECIACPNGTSGINNGDDSLDDCLRRLISHFILPLCHWIQLLTLQIIYMYNSIPKQ